MTSQRLVDRQKEGGGRRVMKEREQEKKEEPSSLKGHWPLSSFPPQLGPSHGVWKPSLIWVELRAAEPRRPARVGLVSRNFSNTSVTSLPIQQNGEGAPQYRLVPRLHGRPHRQGRSCSRALQLPGMCVSPHGTLKGSDFTLVMTA